MENAEVKALRTLIERFLNERLQTKIEKLQPDDPKRDVHQQQYLRETWLANAAQRVSALQLATHIIKATHPAIKGATSLYCAPSSLQERPELGSHALSHAFSEDVTVANAAHLDVYAFLKLKHGDITLLSRALEGDEELAAAFSDDQDQGREWIQAFAAIARPRDTEASHTLAKQVYWLVGEDPTRDQDYHLLAPLYATSLAHRVFQTINEHRFADEAKAARKARRERAYSDTGYHEYPRLAVQKLGGTKPQNISQLNSERRGQNYLLASLPPNWISRDVRPPLHVESVFPRMFGRRRGARDTARELQRFLATDPPANAETRHKRDRYLETLIDELLLFTSELHSLEPGWSASPECRLNRAERLWLDPWRGEIDEDFAQQREGDEWVEEVSHRFGNWVNAQLDRQLPVGDPEHRHWMDSLREVLSHA